MKIIKKSGGGGLTPGALASAINSATEDTLALATDQLPMTETAASGALRRLTFANLFAFIRTQLGLMSGAVTAAGNWAFPSTTRPTSAGTGTPAANSLITRADGDARYFQNQFARQGAQISKTDTTPATVASLTIEAGTYRIFARCVAQVAVNGNTSGGAQMVVSGSNFSNVSGRRSRYPSHQALRTEFLVFEPGSSQVIFSAGPDYSAAQWFTSGFGGVIFEIDIIATCTAGTVNLGVAQWATNAQPTLFLANQATLLFERISN